MTNSATTPVLTLLSVFDDAEFVGNVIWYILLVLSLTFHEYGHAWSAKQLGDDTAERMGRLTLNPIVHLDPIFTVLMPLLFLFAPGGAAASSIFICAAKPVPVNPFNLRRPTRDMMITSAAGPAMNIVLALFFTAAYWFHTEVREIDVDRNSSKMIMTAIQLNLGLAIFNMLPIPPLDGHRVLGYFLPANLRERYYDFGRHGFLILIGLMYFGVLGNVMGPILVQVGDVWGHLMPSGKFSFTK